MSEQSAERPARAGVGSVIVSCVFALIVGAVAGIVTTFAHASVQPWGLIAGLAIAVALVLGFRLVFDSRLVAAVAAAGFVGGSLVLTFPAAGAPILTLNDGTGWVWSIAPAVLALAAIAQPWPRRASERP
jgi:N-acetyl-1-D-myo-inositol-2-amino-2-deoxy-alpha-D-glucopyranoside deacetylase